MGCWKCDSVIFLICLCFNLKSGYNKCINVLFYLLFVIQTWTLNSLKVKLMIKSRVVEELAVRFVCSSSTGSRFALYQNQSHCPLPQRRLRVCMFTTLFRAPHTPQPWPRKLVKLTCVRETHSMSEMCCPAEFTWEWHHTNHCTALYNTVCVMQWPSENTSFLLR